MNDKKHRTTALARKHIGDQRALIERQRELIDDLAKAESGNVRSARHHLKEMLDTLDRMLAGYRSLEPEFDFQNEGEPRKSPQSV